MKQAMLITLKDVFGYTSKEIASMLRVSNESIKTALHRSRKKLKFKNSNIDLEDLTPNHEIIIALSQKQYRNLSQCKYFIFIDYCKRKIFR
ncbi:sigma factor-like helix-turn-helix DNA-binding protein [Ureibacillus chungkukjangi]|uniref:sigma-70 region 4 domain-containing protein n=1 Tax=Ureibacillus chungkukjangi TaxID=1202712 RepID=UPI00203D7CF7|nr:sigma factor-like helix-turn-helix DNA-binding protein [Ureibacillus chungkukjangi]